MSLFFKPQGESPMPLNLVRVSPLPSAPRPCQSVPVRCTFHISPAPFHTIRCKKVDSINEHIDQVMEDAPTKLKVTVTVCDSDWQKMQGLHTQWLGEEKQMLVDQHKQQEVLWLKQSQRLTDIVKNNEGVWISTKLFYIVGSLSLLSIITIAIEIAFYVYFHWIQ